MQIVKIKSEINDLNDKFCCKQLIAQIEFLIEYDFNKVKLFYRCSFSLIITCIIIFDAIFYGKNIDLKPFKKYVNDCKNFIIYEKDRIYNKYPYISICLSALNMQDYIEKNLLSIINQSFQDFEIIIVNDSSEDETENIIKKIQLEDDRIKLVSHFSNLGVYRSRIESILNSKGKFVLLMDPDDMYLNENLFKELYDYNKKKNIDIK